MRRGLKESKAYDDLYFFINTIKKNDEFNAFFSCGLENTSYDSDKYNLMDMIVKSVDTNDILWVECREIGKKRSIFLSCSILKGKSAITFCSTEKSLPLLDLILWIDFEKQLKKAVQSSTFLTDSFHITFFISKMERTWNEIQGEVKIVTIKKLMEWFANRDVAWKPDKFY